MADQIAWFSTTCIDVINKLTSTRTIIPSPMHHKLARHFTTLLQLHYSTVDQTKCLTLGPCTNLKGVRKRILEIQWSFLQWPGKNHINKIILSFKIFQESYFINYLFVNTNRSTNLPFEAPSWLHVAWRHSTPRPLKPWLPTPASTAVHPLGSAFPNPAQLPGQEV